MKEDKNLGVLYWSWKKLIGRKTRYILTTVLKKKNGFIHFVLKRLKLCTVELFLASIVTKPAFLIFKPAIEATIYKLSLYTQNKYTAGWRRQLRWMFVISPLCWLQSSALFTPGDPQCLKKGYRKYSNWKTAITLVEIFQKSLIL